jgi:hypothetical protein
MKNIKDNGERASTTKVLPMSVVLTSISPFTAIAAILWRVFAMDRGRFAWSESLVALVAIVAVVTGVVGGMYLASRRSAWWISIALLSAILGYLELQVIFASALGHMH